MTGSETSPATRPHLNQPDGPEHASLLPHVAGRERELRALADAVRRVVDYSVRHIASPEVTARRTRRRCHRSRVVSASYARLPTRSAASSTTACAMLRRPR